MKLKSFQALQSSFANPASWLVEYFGGSKSKSGVSVNSSTTLGLPAVYYAVNKLAGHIATMPIDVFTEDDDGNKKYIKNSPVNRLLNGRPNDIMTAYQLKELMMVHALITGNGRAYIERNANGAPIGLIPLLPDRCKSMMVQGKKYHIVTRDDNVWGDFFAGLPLENGGWWKVPDRDVVHIMSLSYNGVWGLHLMDIARDVFGLGIAGQDGAAKSMANSGSPGLLLEAPRGTFRTQKEANEFLEAFNDKHEGIQKAGKTGLLRDGMKAITVPVSAQDAQFLEQRQFQREEVALLFGLESIMGDNSGQTYRSITERNTAYVQNTLNRWFQKWEEELQNKVELVGTHKVNFDPLQLLRGDVQSQAQYTLSLSQQQVLTTNELRAIHGYPPVEGGDEVPAVQNAKLAEKAAEQPQPEKEIEEEDESED